jgi:ribosome-associated translation inhibitor RaiA
MSCRVTLTLLENHKHQGKPIGVQIAVTLPGQEVVTGREQNEDPYVALRDAFDNMTRMLQEAMRKRRDPIKIPPS